MAGLWRAVRFMHVVPPVPGLMRTTWVVVTVVCGGALAAGHVRPRDALTPVLVLQVFSVSTGFAAYARRGHYDVLLTSGVGRARAALAQWLVAAAPGVASWMLLAATAAAARQPADLLSGPAAAGMCLVSTLPWAATVGLPRFSAAIGWVLLGAVTLSLLPGIVDAPHAGGGWMAWLSASGTALVFPMRMLDQMGGAPPRVLVPVAIVGVVSMLAALWWLHRSAFPLESGQ